MAEIAINLKQQFEELRVNRNQLLSDVNQIQNGYKGNDATMIIEKYKEIIMELDTFIQNMENFQILLEWLSGSYRDLHNQAKNNLNMYTPLTPLADIDSNNLLSYGFNLDEIVKGQ